MSGEQISSGELRCDLNMNRCSRIASPRGSLCMRIICILYCIYKCIYNIIYINIVYIYITHALSAGDRLPRGGAQSYGTSESSPYSTCEPRRLTLNSQKHHNGLNLYGFQSESLYFQSSCYQRRLIGVPFYKRCIIHNNISYVLLILIPMVTI